MFGVEFVWSAVWFMLIMGVFLAIVWVGDRWDRKRMAARQKAADRVVKSGFDPVAVEVFHQSRHAPRGSLQDSFRR